ncbi:MAG TPA: molybdopterin converting factor [Chitinophagaceae bacterium]|nr:molybdopterin converting factor [Chitinophagaceae bacterium]
MIMQKKKKNVFIEGPISSEFIAQSIAKHSSQTNIGAHAIFLGQVRNDKMEDAAVVGIEYSSYLEMADEIFDQMREETFAQFPLTCMHIYHSLGLVKAGEISLFVFTSAIHRREALDACDWIVERIKKEAPVWGKEILDNHTYSWKTNSVTPFNKKVYI